MLFIVIIIKILFFDNLSIITFQIESFNTKTQRTTFLPLEYLSISGILNIFNNYLRNRRLLYQTCEGQKERTVTAGAAQGSVLGPDLWNLAYDSLLKLEVPEETILVGYADDVAADISEVVRESPGKDQPIDASGG